MPKLKITHMTPEKLSICPVCYPDWSGDNSSEMVELKGQLAKIDLLENVDYQIEKSGSLSTIHFNGKSCVVRALWTIPEDMIFFFPSVCNKNTYNKAKLNYAVKLSQKDCAVHDMQFVERAFEDIYAYVKNEITKIHVPEAKQTPVMEQLNRDLSLISELALDLVWKGQAPKSELVCASLAKACEDEKSNPPVVDSKLNFFNKPSTLAPRYEAILKYICAIEDLDFAKVMPLLIESYNKNMLPKRNQQAAAMASAAAPASAAAGASAAK